MALAVKNLLTTETTLFVLICETRDDDPGRKVALQAAHAVVREKLAFVRKGKRSQANFERRNIVYTGGVESNRRRH